MNSNQNETDSERPQTGSEEAVETIASRFESYASDLTTRIEHGARAGTASERVRNEADTLIREYRGRIERSDDLAEAQKWLSEFKREAERLRP